VLTPIGLRSNIQRFNFSLGTSQPNRAVIIERQEVVLMDGFSSGHLNVISNPEKNRLIENHAGESNWHRWGPYLSERAWGTVREDYSANGDAWNYFPHDHARSRAYRWNEDGMGGFSDDKQYLCLAVALWNEKDPILKERMFGLTNQEGNHGEDVKEYYFSWTVRRLIPI
jgi:hypothetical protein